MPASVEVLCAVRGAAESVVATALDGAARQITVLRRCADCAELLAAAAAGLGRLAVVSVDLPHLDREAVAQLHAGRTRVLALAAPGQAARALALGIDAVVADDVDAAGLVAAVLALAEAAEEDLVDRASSSATPDHAVLAEEPDVTGAGADGSPAPPGLIVAVWGPTGAPGRSTIALNLAAELAGAGALVVDADTYGGTIASLVGMMDESPGLAAAARAAAQGNLDLAGLARLTPVLAPGLRVLTGISRANRWPELPASALEVVWDVARSLAAWTVIDCGFCLEQDEALSYDTRAPRRNAATLSALEAADVVVVVGSGDPVGIQRLVRGITDLAALPVPITAARTVVVNRVRASAAGPRPGPAIHESLGRYAGVEGAHLVPDDRPALDAAVLRGATLLEVAPGSPARRAIAALAATLTRPAARAGLRGGMPRVGRFVRTG
ncbi:MAG: AAA family ATPase [Cellulomonas sp.]